MQTLKIEYLGNYTNHGQDAEQSFRFAVTGLLEKADKRVYIPMAGRAESLNVAMAAGIVMFEALRRKVK